MASPLITVTLSPEETIVARHIARERDKKDREAHVKDQLVTKRDPVTNTINSVGAEFAAARYLNLWPDLSYMLLKRIGQDLNGHGWVIDVKLGGSDRFSIHAPARECDAYIGVSGVMPRYSIRGWIRRDVVIVDRSPYWNPEATKPCWQVFYDTLLPILELQRLMGDALKFRVWTVETT